MQVLTPKAVQGYAHVLSYEAHIFIRSLYDESKKGTLPISPSHYTGRYVLKSVHPSTQISRQTRTHSCFSNMLTISFGTRTDLTTDPLIERALALTMEFMDLTGTILLNICLGLNFTYFLLGPWSNAIDFIEPLQWIPTRMRSRGRKLHDDLIEVYGAMILQVKARMDSGEDVPDCLVKTLIETQDDEGLDWEDICMLAAVFMLGGIHSVSLGCEVLRRSCLREMHHTNRHLA